MDFFGIIDLDEKEEENLELSIVYTNLRKELEKVGNEIDELTKKYNKMIRELAKIETKINNQCSPKQ